MNSIDLCRAVSGVDDNILERSEAAGHACKEKNKWLKWGAVAACLCLLLAGAAVWQQLQPSSTEGAGISVSENGVTIPPMDVSLSANIQADMIGFFIYQGRCYVQYEWIYNDADIIGEYLGTATGLIDEWTPKEGYVELAGSVRGDFYAVKGYDPSFMLCMKYPTGAVSTYICNNGITLKYGSELYEDRLHLSDGFRSVQYESRDSWFYSRGECYQLNSVNDILDFIEGMNSAQFIPSDSVFFEDGQTSVSNTELYHLYFLMENGTTIHLRLHKNGYVRFQGMTDLCVQLPGERYGALLELLDNHIDSTAVEAAGDIGPTLEDCLNDAELGRYVPTYAPAGFCFNRATIYYYLDRQTANETGTKEIQLEYDSFDNPRCDYAITVTWADEYGQNGWAGPMIDAERLSVESLAEYIETESATGRVFPECQLHVGVWFDDVSVVISAQGVDAETAYEIFNSIP